MTDKEGLALPQGLSVDTRLYLRPMGILATGGPVPADSMPLCGGPLVFTHVMLYWRRPGERAGKVAISLDQLRDWASRERGNAARRADELLGALSAHRPPLACGETDLVTRPGAPRLMGVVNVTPDSFFESSAHGDAEAAIAHGRTLACEGADILDVGGESTRPGASPVDRDEEWRRVGPVIEGLRGEGPVISIDSRHAPVMARAHAAGASLVNDVTALEGDSASLGVAADLGCPVVLMHMQGTPETMQRAPHYDDVLLDVFDYLESRIAAAAANGISRTRLIVDPGIGFGKSRAHNAALLGGISLFHGLGCPVLVGASRKSFIAAMWRAERRSSGRDPDEEPAAADRLPGSIAAALVAASAGVQLLRVHDVAATWQALAVWRQSGGIREPGPADAAR